MLDFPEFAEHFQKDVIHPLVVAGFGFITFLTRESDMILHTHQRMILSDDKYSFHQNMMEELSPPINHKTEPN